MKRNQNSQPFYQYRHLLGETRLRDWFTIRRSNLFIIPFAIAVVITYSLLTRGWQVSSVLNGALVGLSVGYLIALIETYSQDWQRVCKRRTFSNSLLRKTLRLALLFSMLFTLLIPAFILIDFLFGYAIFTMGLGEFLQKQFIELLGISLSISFVANFFVEINRKLGPGVLLKLISGRYHQPEAQERTFLFVDLKDSTTLAETLGELRFSEFLQDFFYDISDTISRYQGEIYQYVGDEVVITWKNRLDTRDNRAVECFMAIQQRIEEIENYYRDTYGYIPQFKGSIHRGGVVIAEVGKVKSEIAYHGDVLNTTARILALCRTLEHDLLISSDVYDHLNPDEEWELLSMGVFHLKGKTREVSLYAVEKMVAGEPTYSLNPASIRTQGSAKSSALAS